MVRFVAGDVCILRIQTSGLMSRACICFYFFLLQIAFLMSTKMVGCLVGLMVDDVQIKILVFPACSDSGLAVAASISESWMSMLSRVSYKAGACKMIPAEPTFTTKGNH